MAALVLLLHSTVAGFTLLHRSSFFWNQFFPLKLERKSQSACRITNQIQCTVFTWHGESLLSLTCYIIFEKFIRLGPLDRWFSAHRRLWRPSLSYRRRFSAVA
ncbi:hypothetical protein OIU85_005355 [Salix viminalis]|uniref:Uncharacterized protein n=1 Tax=Salix viminalis TaxID=40686 RepID=A0A9Q0STW8_SALVM|nr:hypothetical protein OIU85_005355 [Salix viminalis]